MVIVPPAEVVTQAGYYSLFLPLPSPILDIIEKNDVTID